MQSHSLIRPELLVLSPEHFRALWPYLTVFLGSVLGILLGTVRTLNPKWSVFLISLATCIGGGWVAVNQLALPAQAVFNQMMLVDTYSSFFNILILGTAAFSIISSLRYLDHEKMQYPEYYTLMLLSALGMMVMVAATDLVVLFVALELMSISVYVLVGFRRTDTRSNEAAMKYFLLGSAASAVLLYGVALLYGASGSTDIKPILAMVQGQRGAMVSPMFVLGSWLVSIGFLFKVAAVPFHMWMPDVYEGAPTPVTGFMTTGLKAASFAAFLRVFVSLGYGKGLAQSVEAHLHDILWICAVLTMVVGNILALQQTNLKRMLGYSSIAHTGYLIVGLLAGPKSGEGFAPIVVYLVGYSVMNLGAFAVLTILSGRDDRGLNLHDLNGLAQRRPWMAFAMAIFLFSLAGIPPTVGFVAKYMLFYSAIQAGEITLVVISVLCSAISVYYYLRVLVAMYMRDPAGSSVPATRTPMWSAVGVAVMVALTLQMGLMPNRVMEAAKRAVTGL